MTLMPEAAMDAPPLGADQSARAILVESPPTVRTIGITIPLPEPYRSTLQAHRASYGDPAADTIPPHVTLMPPTEVLSSDLADLIEHAAAVASRHTPFVIELAGTDTFRPISPVVFVRLVAGHEACGALEADLRSGPIRRDLEFAYHPHVTVAHHVATASLDRAAAELAGFAGSFLVASFELDELGPDEAWQPVRTFRIGGPS